MNAVSLYLSTCRYVMQAKKDSPTSWCDLYKYLPYLRQALACCVCTKILQIPVGPIDSICQHHICDGCRGGKMRLRPSCSWCKNHEIFIENTQLRIIVQCYKKLCCFLSSLNLSTTLGEVENGDKNSLLKIISEGVEIADIFDYNANPLSMCLLSSTPIKEEDAANVLAPSDLPGPAIVPLTAVTTPPSVSPTKAKSKRSRRRRTSSAKKRTHPVPPPPPAPSEPKNSTQTSKPIKTCNQDTQTDGPTEHDYNKDDLDDTNIDEIRQRSAHLRSRDDTGENAPQRSKLKAPHLGEHDYMKGPLCYSVVMPNGDEPKLTIKRRPTIQVHISKKKSKMDKNFSHASSLSGVMIPRSRKQKGKDGKRTGCRCGMATPTPGKLTCCGQRCPCYTAWKPCVDCICRGCHNPRKELPPMLSGANVVAEEVEISVV